MSEVRSLLRQKEAAMVVGKLNTNNFLLKVDFETCIKQTTMPAFQLAKPSCFHVNEEAF